MRLIGICLVSLICGRSFGLMCVWVCSIFFIVVLLVVCIMWMVLVVVLVIII